MMMEEARLDFRLSRHSRVLANYLMQGSAARRHRELQTCNEMSRWNMSPVEVNRSYFVVPVPVT
jgi:hypothetical protein